ncbi:MAG: hypothetical protein WD533_02560 [Dehalococcoidia bacterium]
MSRFGISARQADVLTMLLVAGAALVSSLVYLAAMLTVTGGAMAAPLDDSYIYFQYARAIAEGHPFAYTEGAEITMGATGLLYPVILAPAFFIGLGGDGIVAYSYALNTIFLMVVAALVYRVALHHVRPLLATTAGLLTALAGPVLWGFMSLMEVGLLALVLMLVAYFYSIERYSFPPWRTLAAAAVLPFCRPEGVFMAVFLVGIVLAGHVSTRYTYGRWFRLREAREPTASVPSGAAFDVKPWLRPINLMLLLPLVAAAAYPLTVWLLIGTLSTNTLMSKGIQYIPQLHWYQEMGAVLNNAATLLQNPFGFRPDYLPIVMMPILGLGLAYKVGQEFHARQPGLGILALGVFFIGVLSNSQSIGALVHHYRYIVPLFPLAMVFGAIGLGTIGRLHRDGPYLAVGAAAILLLLMLINSGRWVETYANDVSDIHYQQVHMGGWIDENIPEGAIVGINDAGAMAYFGNRTVYDLVGLVSAGASLPHRDHTGAVFERILSLPEDERPDYLAIYPHWFGFPDGQFINQIYYAHLRRTTIAGGNTVAVYEVDYSVAAGADQPEMDHTEGGAWEMVGTLNSANMEDEARHDYEQIDLVPRAGKEVTVLKELVYADNGSRRLIDGGRIVLGAEEFTVTTRQGEDLKIAMRTDAHYPATLAVYADGAYVGDWTYSNNREAWVESAFVVPGEFVGDGETRLRLELDMEYTERDFAPFRYWFYQPSGPTVE